MRAEALLAAIHRTNSPFFGVQHLCIYKVAGAVLIRRQPLLFVDTRRHKANYWAIVPVNDALKLLLSFARVISIVTV